MRNDEYTLQYVLRHLDRVDGNLFRLNIHKNKTNNYLLIFTVAALIYGAVTNKRLKELEKELVNKKCERYKEEVVM